MALSAGTKLGSYEIVEPLGAGGMGEVYRARDSKLKREVAIKVLPEEFYRDAERLARFQREAEILASLNHPHISAIYDLLNFGELRVLVLELVEGETLAERLKQGPVPLDETLIILKQVCEALEAAHEKGFVHRDLKPANIKITPEGRVKLLDFGLARMFEVTTPVSDWAGAPTLVSGVMPGALLGTAEYMSPEQAKGKTADARSDIWAFGVVLYEVLTGKSPFAAETFAETLGGITKVDPDWTALPASTPLSVRSILRRCLQRDRNRRTHCAADLRIEIEEAQSAPQAESSIPRSVPRRRERIAWATALALVTAVAVVLALLTFREPPPAPEARLEIGVPPGTNSQSIAISPDGQKIVFVAASEGIDRLWLRSLDDVSALPLAGTEFAASPFWSPDNRSIGFFADFKLKRMDIDGGSMQILASAPNGGGGTWNREGTILFTPDVGSRSSIFAISATGGEPESVTRLDGFLQAGHSFPEFLPDGQHFLYYVRGSPEVRGVYAGQLGGSETRRLLDAEARAVYASSGQLLFMRQGTLFAQDFDAVRLELRGNPFPVAEQVRVAGGTGAAAFSASGAGPLIYRTGTATLRQFIWFDRSGSEIGTVGSPLFALNPSLSPDGLRVALDQNADIWFLEIVRGVLGRFTSGMTSENQPVWSPDGKLVVFSSPRMGAFDLYEKPVSGAGTEDLLLATEQNKVATDWSRDGNFVLFRSTDPETNHDIWALPTGGDQKPFMVVQTNFQERDAQFSPDGKWIAYQSDESGRFEIYLQPFPGPGVKSTISTNGGAQVRWRSDGKELFYIALDGRLMAVPMNLASGSSSGQTFEAGAPVPLFATRIGGAVQGTARQQYVVSPNGQRFLMNTVTDEDASPITVVLNWKPR